MIFKLYSLVSFVIRVEATPSGMTPVNGHLVSLSLCVLGLDRAGDTQCQTKDTAAQSTPVMGEEAAFSHQKRCCRVSKLWVKVQLRCRCWILGAQQRRKPKVTPYIAKGSFCLVLKLTKYGIQSYKGGGWRAGQMSNDKGPNDNCSPLIPLWCQVAGS